VRHADLAKLTLDVRMRNRCHSGTRDRSHERLIPQGSADPPLVRRWSRIRSPAAQGRLDAFRDLYAHPAPGLTRRHPRVLELLVVEELVLVLLNCGGCIAYSAGEEQRPRPSSTSSTPNHACAPDTSLLPQAAGPNPCAAAPRADSRQPVSRLDSPGGQIIRSLFHNKANGSVIAVSLHGRDAHTRLHCRSYATRCAAPGLAPLCGGAAACGGRAAGAAPRAHSPAAAAAAAAGFATGRH
jgi:hypothetical protein